MARLFTFSATAIIAARPAFAHTGVGDASGFVHGVVHPLSGLDHVLVMLAVGFFAATLGGRALWAVPLAFVTMMAVGGALGANGFGLPLAELAIGISVVALGVAIACRVNMPVVIAMAFVGFFAVFHGHAHGAEMPVTASGLQYAAGFLLATAFLHACGIGLGIALEMLTQARARQVAQIAGGATALVGIGLVSTMI